MPNVKILSLNLHCLVEDNLPDKQKRIATLIDTLDVDIVVLQEVAQSLHDPIVHDLVKQDNYAYVLQQLLASMNKTYHLIYKPFKSSFGRFDEGLAFLSKVQPDIHAYKRISQVEDYQDWHTRYVLNCRFQFGQKYLYIANTHFGWTDETERFESQFDLAIQTLPTDQPSLLIGDCNITPTSAEYNHVIASGFIDIFDTPEWTNQPTHADYIDVHKQASRIDYMFSSQPLEITDRQIHFTDNPVSDHFAIYISFPFN